MVKTMVRQAILLQPMDVHSGADIHLQPTEDAIPEQVDAQRKLWPHGRPAMKQAPGRTCRPVESEAHAGASLLAGLLTQWDIHTRAVCS